MAGDKILLFCGQTSSLKIEKMTSETRPNYFYNQSAVIPFKLEDGKLKLLMISNRKRSRWIFPKGIIEQHLTPQQSAAKEAFEEAGIKGKVYSNEIGNYRYKKWGGVCAVQVYLLQIEEILTDWPEANFRNRIWVGIDEAKQLVREDDLKNIVSNLNFFISNFSRSSDS